MLRYPNLPPILLRGIGESRELYRRGEEERYDINIFHRTVHTFKLDLTLDMEKRGEADHRVEELEAKAEKRRMQTRIRN